MRRGLSSAAALALAARVHKKFEARSAIGKKRNFLAIMPRSAGYFQVRPQKTLPHHHPTSEVL
jgi:hypothetical protein